MRFLINHSSPGRMPRRDDDSAPGTCVLPERQ
ncbi:hypothetical protein FHS82_003949 [Pseudochelatococcus lubricantis]|uniref:Uncharacterized protein n=1 Tax=Pseudochelatococcus lubricantis TaxID=1538102 RepID=A0ABX0V4K5_9HYPH|nr:hypothetical protein [Pseudochelatococcus lubricantis]